MVTTQMDDLAILNRTSSGKGLVSWVEEQYKKLKGARLQYESQWRLNYAFYKGKQYYNILPTNLSSVTGRLVEPNVPRHRVRSVRNKIKPIIRTEISKLNSNKPTAYIIPASNEDRDLYAAQAGEKVWEMLYTQRHVPQVFTRMTFWLAICGTAFIKDWWDPTCTEYGSQYVGNIKFGSVTPFHLLVPDFFEEEIEDQPFLIYTSTKPVEWVKVYYGIDANSDVSAMSGIMGDGVFKASNNSQAKPDSVLIKEAWFKPGGHPMFPAGGMVTFLNGQIVAFWDQGMYYKHEEYPFTKFSHIPTGEFYADSVIDDLIPVQRDLNKTSSQIIESKNKMAVPQLIAPIGSIDPSKVTSAPGQVILYKPGLGAPQPLQTQPLPSYVLQEIERAHADLQDISSQHEVSHGGVPTGVTAATAISYLQERDDSAMATTYQSVEFGYQKMAKHALSHVVEYWDTPRIVSVTGVDSFFDALVLKGSEIASGTDIRMESGSALPTSKSAKQAFIIDMMTKGFIPPDKGLSLMDMGGIERLYDELKADERQAGRENLRMASLDVADIFDNQQQYEQAKYLTEMLQQQQAPAAAQQNVQTTLPGMPADVTDPNNAMQALDGLEQLSGPAQPQINSGFGQDATSQAPLLPSPSVVPVNTYDNHQVHIDVHNRFRKSQAFELLPDPLKQEFETHVQMHASALNQAAMQAATMMPAPDNSSNPFAGAANSSGAPVGSNQFGPPGTTDGGSTPPPIS